MYNKDPNNKFQQVPGGLPTNAYDRMVTPETGSFVKTPNYVIVNETPANPIGFYFGTSASFAALEAGTVSASRHYTNFGKPVAGTILAIHPTAWSGSFGGKTTSEAGGQIITFVYKSGLSTGGAI